MNLSDLPAKSLLRPDEVATFFSVSTQTIYNWCAGGTLEGTLINGTTLRVLRASVIMMVEEGKDLAAGLQPPAAGAQPRRVRRVLSRGVKE